VEVAKTILRQLGGQQFIAMTGARDFVGGEKALHFSLRKGAKDRIEKVLITLEPTDTYMVEFFRWDRNRLGLEQVAHLTLVYADQLQAVFTEHTGLVTRL
jgi:hypothetical protein